MHRPALLLALTLAIGLPAGSPRAGTQPMIAAFEAYAVYKMGRFEEALAMFRALAEDGVTQGMLNLAHMYAAGQGVAADPEQALHWYRRGAEAGDPVSMYYTAQCHAQGRGTHVDAEQAGYWFLRAAQAGLAEAQFELGKRLINAGDTAQGRAWLEQAHAQGLAEARLYLGRSQAPVTGLAPESVDAVRAALAAIDRAAQQKNAPGVIHYLARDARVRVRLPGAQVYEEMDRRRLGELWQATFDRVSDYDYRRSAPELTTSDGFLVAESVIEERLGSAQGSERLRLHERARFKDLGDRVRVEQLDLRIERLSDDAE